MRLLLGSGGFRTPERIQSLTEQMRALFGDIGRLLFIPYALADHDGYIATMNERGLNAGYTLEGIQRQADPVKAVAQAEGLFVGGGNTFRLLDTLQRLHLLDVIKQRVAAGMPYLGVSAGSNVACPTLMTTNDMPIVQPASFRALALVPFQLNAHYYHGQNFVKPGDGALEPHFGETREERIKEFHEMNDTPVIGLWEAGMLRIEDRRMSLIGTPARLFRKGEEPADVLAGSDLSPWLGERGE